MRGKEKRSGERENWFEQGQLYVELVYENPTLEHVMAE